MIFVRILSLMGLMMAAPSFTNAFQIVAPSQTTLRTRLTAAKNDADKDECNITNIEKARDCATKASGDECSLEELETLSKEMRMERVQNEIFGMCSEDQMDLEMIENELRSQLEHFSEGVNAVFQSRAVSAPAKASSASKIPSPPNPEKVMLLTNSPDGDECGVAEVDVARAKDCATADLECSLEEMEVLQKGIRRERVQNEIFGMCSEDQAELQKIEEELRAQLERFSQKIDTLFPPQGQNIDRL